MWKLASLGGSLLVAGSVKFTAELNRIPTLEDYLAFRCGPAEHARLAGFAGRTLLDVAHCWGCYAMVAGAGLLVAAALWSAARRQGRRIAPE